MVHPLRDAISAGRLCRHLRSKGLYVPGDHGPPEDRGYTLDTAAFWCNGTGCALGPDQRPANPERCGDLRRACFEGVPPA